MHPQLWVQTQQDTEWCKIKLKILHSPQKCVAHTVDYNTLFETHCFSWAEHHHCTTSICFLKLTWKQRSSCQGSSSSSGAWEHVTYSLRVFNWPWVLYVCTKAEVELNMWTLETNQWFHKVAVKTISMGSPYIKLMHCLRVTADHVSAKLHTVDSSPAAKGIMYDVMSQVSYNKSFGTGPHFVFWSHLRASALYLYHCQNLWSWLHECSSLEKQERVRESHKKRLT